MEKYLELIKKHLGNCKNCSSGDISVQANFYMCPIVENDGVNLTKGFPFMIAHCRNCGYVHLFNKEFLEQGIAS